MVGSVKQCRLWHTHPFFRTFAPKRTPMSFVDVKNDIAFYKIFGNENKKIILLSFLNSVMRLRGEDAISNYPTSKRT